jgi:hypothetical protein
LGIVFWWLRNAYSGGKAPDSATRDQNPVFREWLRQQWHDRPNTVAKLQGKTGYQPMILSAAA